MAKQTLKKKIFINQQNLESSLSHGHIILEGSMLKSNNMHGYYQLIPAIKFTSCVSDPGDPLNYVGKCAALILFEQKGIEVHMSSIDYHGVTYEVDEGFLGDYFTDGETEDEALSQHSEENGISYDPKLIQKLNDDHKTILEIFGEIIVSAEEDDFDTVSRKLELFGNRLRLHLMTEQIKFHTYLEQALAHCTLTQKMNKTFQERIKVIGNTALDFLAQYEDQIWTDKSKKSFITGMKGIGEVLVERITMEEELYELYLPKSAYQGAI